MNLQEEIMDNMAKQMSESIDFELLSDVLIACGWHRVKLDTIFNRKRKTLVLEWCEENVKNKFKHHNGTFMFEDQGDAVNFTLKWL